MEKINDEAFSRALMRELINALPNWYGSDNWDLEVMPFRESLGEWIFSQLRSINEVLFRNTTIVRRADFGELVESLSRLEKSLDGLSAFYQLLQDDYSRSLLVLIIAHRIMGFRKVKLPINTPAFWAKRKVAETLLKSNARIELKFRNFVLQHLELGKLGYPLEIFCQTGTAVKTFILKQYEYQRKVPVIKAKAGDHVIDAGGCWGDTALYFAETVGRLGNVYTFEFVPDNLEVLDRNFALNPELSKRIQTIPRALWDRSYEEVAYSPDGPATSLVNDAQGSMRVLTLSIDDFVSGAGLPRIDFIKMDIEGSELRALKGAEQTLRIFKPRLAIAIYHKDEDFIAIPKYLTSLGLGYELYLDHFSIYRAETILFANPGVA